MSNISPSDAVCVEGLQTLLERSGHYGGNMVTQGERFNVSSLCPHRCIVGNCRSGTHTAMVIETDKY